MRRITLEARPNWIARAEEIGFTYHSLGQSPDDTDGVYWYEQVAYEFTATEVDIIEAATEELHARCLDAVDYVVKHPEEMDRFGIPHAFRPYVQQTWERRDPCVMGRFDLAFDPATQAVKMLEYNADTPTLVIETALMQWFWLQDRFPNMDQFNSLHEKLIDAFESIGRRIPQGETLYFAALSTSAEEFQHCRYFQDLAEQAFQNLGKDIRTAFIAIPDIGYDARRGFLDLDEQPIRFLHKLYPWEWMAHEQFGPCVLEDRTGIVEPAWKMLLSNKALLPLLWRLFPNHPNLLPAYWQPDQLNGRYIAKPILAREGANMELRRPGQEPVITGGSYGSNPVVYQAVVDLPRFNGQHVVIGSWIANNKAAGMIIRESTSPIVVNTSKVVPHFFVPAT